MTRDEQKKFIKEMAAHQMEEIIDLIDKGRVPEHFHGEHLRVLFAEHVQGVASMAPCKRVRRSVLNAIRVYDL